MTGKIITLTLLLVILAGGYYLYTRPSFPELPNTLQFQRIDGSRHDLGRLKGKPSLIVFWSPSCRVCLQEVEHFNQLYKSHRGGQDFELLALSMYYDRPDWVIETSREQNMRYPVYFDLKQEISKAFGNVVATPTSFLLNSRTEIVYRWTGKVDFSLVQQKLEELMSHAVSVD